MQPVHSSSSPEAKRSPEATSAPSSQGALTSPRLQTGRELNLHTGVELLAASGLRSLGALYWFEMTRELFSERPASTKDWYRNLAYLRTLARLESQRLEHARTSTARFKSYVGIIVDRLNDCSRLLFSDNPGRRIARSRENLCDIVSSLPVIIRELRSGGDMQVIEVLSTLPPIKAMEVEDIPRAYDRQQIQASYDRLNLRQQSEELRRLLLDPSQDKEACAALLCTTVRCEFLATLQSVYLDLWTHEAQEGEWKHVLSELVEGLERSAKCINKSGVMLVTPHNLEGSIQRCLRFCARFQQTALEFNQTHKLPNRAWLLFDTRAVLNCLLLTRDEELKIESFF